MKYHLEVITLLNSKDFLHDLEKRMRWIKQRGYSLELSVIRNEAAASDRLTLTLGDEHAGEKVFRYEDIICIFKHQIAEALAEHIVNEWEGRLIWKEIQRTCKHISREERQSLFRRSQEFLRRCHENESLNSLMNYGRKNRIAHRIMDHVEHQQCLIVQGFITFCMKDYLTEIKFALEVAVEELKSEKEYTEFVNLLRYFVDSQVPRIFEVNLRMEENGVFYLWDGDGTVIEDNYMSYYLEDILLDEINLDDVLISILITIAPRRLIIHASDHLPHSASVDMIKNVFQEKIVFCPGCERCQMKGGKSCRNHP